MCGVYETRELESAVGISVGGYVARSIRYSHTSQRAAMPVVALGW